MGRGRIKEDKIEELEKLRSEKQKKDKQLKQDNEQLEDLIRRQRPIIGELKSQCLEVTNKFEESYNSWKKEKEIMKTEMTRLDSPVNDISERNS
jgi:chromosome segregation ATPase